MKYIISIIVSIFVSISSFAQTRSFTPNLVSVQPVGTATLVQVTNIVNALAGSGGPFVAKNAGTRTNGIEISMSTNPITSFNFGSTNLMKVNPTTVLLPFGNDLGRGSIQLFDSIDNRSMELGFYQFGASLKTSNLFEIYSVGLSVHGFGNPPNAGFIQVRNQSDSGGLNLIDDEYSTPARVRIFTSESNPHSISIDPNSVLSACFTTNGNVGIGTAFPSNSLHILAPGLDDGTFTLNMRVESTAASGGGIKIKNTAGSSYMVFDSINDLIFGNFKSGGALKLYSTGVNILKIAGDSGWTSIGVPAPSIPRSMLDVSGDIRASTTVAATNGFISRARNLLAPVAITVGSSPFNFTNTAASNASGTNDIYVFVAGGTISEIDINGTALGTGLALGGIETIPLQIGEYCTITYTVSPTMKWKSR